MVEIHFHDSEFTLFSSIAGDESPENTETGGDEAASATGETPGSGSALGVLVALAVLVLIAFAVRRALGGGAEDTPPADPESNV